MDTCGANNVIMDTIRKTEEKHKSSSHRVSHHHGNTEYTEPPEGGRRTRPTDKRYCIRNTDTTDTNSKTVDNNVNCRYGDICGGMFIRYHGNYVTALLLLMTVFLSPSITSGQAVPSNLNIAWMAPYPFFYFFNASTSRGALAYSLDVILNDTSLLPPINTIHVMYRDSGCNSKDGVGAIFDILENNYDMDVIMGPACSPAMKPVAAIASLLNVPVLGWISSDPLVADKTLYTTLVRFLWPVAAIGDGIEIVLKKMEWHRVYLISSGGGDYGTLGQSVYQKLQDLKDDGFVLANWEQNLPEDVSAEAISTIYSDVKDEARIIILCIPQNELRRFMLAAYDADMWRGEYVFIFTSQSTPQQSDVEALYSTEFWQGTDDRGEDAKKAYENLFMMFAKPTTDFARTTEFLDNFAIATQSALPYTYSGTALTVQQPDFYSLFLYDAMMKYAEVATEAYTEQGNDRAALRDGTTIFQKTLSTITKDGATGDVILDDNADRVPEYWIFDLDAEGRFIQSAETQSVKSGNGFDRSLSEFYPFRWGDGTSGMENAPVDTPVCGFQGELCSSSTLYIAVGVAVGVVIIVIIALILVCRKLKYERDLNNQLWKVNYGDVHVYMGGKVAGSKFNFGATSQKLRSSKGSVADSVTGGQMFITVANYKGRIVAVRKLRKDKVKVDRALLQEMMVMMSVKHHNLNVFVGACIDAPDISCVWEYCSKGSLQDVIANDNIQLDDMFKFSIAIDILKGLQYISNSDLKLHGKLKSSNVLIDGRWVVRLTDYGCCLMTSSQIADEEESDHAKFSKLFWTAPEVVRAQYDSFLLDNECLRGTGSSSDVYSCGVVLKEVFCRSDAYTEYDTMDPKEIIEQIKAGDSEPALRPSLSELPEAVSTQAVIQPLNTLITSCWHEDPKERPTIDQTLKKLTKTNPFKKANVMDNMMAIMEKYSKQLEEIVGERTQQLDEEKKKTELLLYKMLPRSVAEDLKAGKSVEAESFDKVTIYFADIVGFSDVAAKSSPFQIVDLLNAIYSLIDDTICHHDVYKVETVGDVYLLVSGLPIRNGDRHIVEVVNCALDVISATDDFIVAHNPKARINVRVGIHTGPVVAGVIGLTNPRYCLFGDTVNTSSRMESNGFGRRIHMSSFAYEALCKFSGFSVASRGVIQVKGKGAMNTYWLIGREGYEKPLPDYQAMLNQDNPAPTFLPFTTGRSQTRAPRPSTESGFSESDVMQNRKISREGSMRKPSMDGSVESRRMSVEGSLRKTSMEGSEGRRTSIEGSEGRRTSMEGSLRRTSTDTSMENNNTFLNDSIRKISHQSHQELTLID